jgi:microcystin-dependent protein
MRGRLPIHAGQGPGLSQRRLGAKSGSEKETLTVNQMPSHTHNFQASQDFANQTSPEGLVVAQSSLVDLYVQDSNPTENFSTATVDNIGGSRSHTNLMPYLCIHFIIALFGIYPSRH